MERELRNFQIIDSWRHYDFYRFLSKFRILLDIKRTMVIQSLELNNILLFLTFICVKM